MAPQVTLLFLFLSASYPSHRAAAFGHSSFIRDVTYGCLGSVQGLTAAEAVLTWPAREAATRRWSKSRKLSLRVSAPRAAALVRLSYGCSRTSSAQTRSGAVGK